MPRLKISSINEPDVSIQRYEVVSSILAFGVNAVVGNPFASANLIPGFINAFRKAKTPEYEAFLMIYFLILNCSKEIYLKDPDNNKEVFKDFVKALERDVIALFKNDDYFLDIDFFEENADQTELINAIAVFIANWLSENFLNEKEKYTKEKIVESFLGYRSKLLARSNELSERYMQLKNIVQLDDDLAYQKVLRLKSTQQDLKQQFEGKPFDGFDLTYRDLYVPPAIVDADTKIEDTLDKYLKRFFSKRGKIIKSPFVIIGNPGQGKTVLSYYILHNYCDPEKPIFLIDGDQFLWGRFELDSVSSIKKEVKRLYKCNLDQNSTVLIDGWDEIKGDFIKRKGEEVFHELEKVDFKIILTSRKGYFDFDLNLTKKNRKQIAIKAIVQELSEEGMVRIIENYEEKKSISDLTSTLKVKIKNDKDLRELFSNSTELLVLSLLNEIQVEEVNRTILLNRIIDKRFKIIFKDKGSAFIERQQYWRNILGFVAFLFENKGSVNINSRKLKKYLSGNEVIADSILELFEEEQKSAEWDLNKILLRGNYITRYDSSFEFELTSIREFFCADYIKERIKELCASDEEKCLSVFQDLFSRKKYSAPIWEHIIFAVNKFSPEVKKNLKNKFEGYLPYVLGNQGLQQYSSKANPTHSPINIAINTFSSYWRIYNVISERQEMLRDNEIIKGLRFCVSLISENHLPERKNMQNLCLSVLSDKEIEGEDFRNVDFSNSDFTGLIFRNCIFSKGLFYKTIFQKTRFEYCDFFNAEFHDVTIDESWFDYSKGVAIEFNDSKFLNVEVKNSNFSKFKTSGNFEIKNCLFENSNFFKSKFQDGEIDNLLIIDSECNQMEFVNTDIQKIDFSGSSVDDVRFCDGANWNKDWFKGVRSLRGAIFPNELIKAFAKDEELGSLIDVEYLEEYNPDHPSISKKIENDKQQKTNDLNLAEKIKFQQSQEDDNKDDGKSSDQAENQRMKDVEARELNKIALKEEEQRKVKEEVTAREQAKLKAEIQEVKRNKKIKVDTELTKEKNQISERERLSRLKEKLKETLRDDIDKGIELLLQYSIAENIVISIENQLKRNQYEFYTGQITHDVYHRTCNKKLIHLLEIVDKIKELKIT